MMKKLNSVSASISSFDYYRYYYFRKNLLS